MRAPDYERGNVRLYCGDCLELLPQLEAGSVDCVVTDPPYGIGGYVAHPSKWRRRAGAKSEQWDNMAVDLSPVLAVAPVAAMAIWGGNNYALPPSRGWLVWHKPDAPPSMADAELCWTNCNQNTRLYSYSIGATNAERVGHPTQKPLAVMEWTLGSISAGETVLDPFMGSGTTGVACVKTGRAFIGMEIEPKYFEIAVRRIDAAFDQFALLDPVPAAKQMELLAPEGKP